MSNNAQTINLPIGGTCTLTAQVYIPGIGFNAGNQPDTGATWATSNSGICSISTAGPNKQCQLTGAGTGTATITLTSSNGSVDTITVNVANWLASSQGIVALVSTP